MTNYKKYLNSTDKLLNYSLKTEYGLIRIDIKNGMEEKEVVKNVVIVLLAVALTCVSGLYVYQYVYQHGKTNDEVRIFPPSPSNNETSLTEDEGEKEATLEGLRGSEILEVLDGSKVKDYVQRENDYYIAGVRGTVIRISDQVLTLSRNGDILSIPVDYGKSVWAATEKTAEGRYRTRTTEFEEIKVGDFVSMKIEVKPNEPLKIVHIMLYSGNLKPSR